jgi:hypothetical protein
MNVFVYQAALLCEECGDSVMDELRREARAEAEYIVGKYAEEWELKYGINPCKQPYSAAFDALEKVIIRSKIPAVNDQSSYDSDEYPKGPYPDGGGEADTPQHCDHCHCFLENPLTSDGYDYVREKQNAEWDSFYDIDRDEEEDECHDS